MRRPLSGRGECPGPHDAPGPFHLDGHAEAGDEIDLAESGRELFARTLGEATCDDEPRPMLSQAVELEDSFDRLLAAASDEGAGVHNDKVGLARILCRLVATDGQAASQLFRVDFILRATERRDPKALVHLRSLPMPQRRSPTIFRVGRAAPGASVRTRHRL